MKNEKPQYRPDDKRSDLKDLFCPNCGDEVEAKHYNETTGLIKCPNCKHLFVFDDQPSQTKKDIQINSVEPQSVQPTSLFLIAFILLIIALIILYFVN